MSQIGIWSIAESGPTRASKTSISLEKDLEDWIERDPGLLRSGLTIVGRQVRMSGVILDLLGITPEGQWACIELKPGPLYRETLAQALDYAALVSAMTADELLRACNRLDNDKRSIAQGLLDRELDDGREVIVMVAGTTVDAGLDRIVQYLSEGFQVPITTVTFDVFRIQGGTQLLVRETVERAQEPEPKPKRTYSVEAIEMLAAERSSRALFDEALSLAREVGLYVRPWASCVTLNPPFKRNMTLFYVAPRDNDTLYFGYSSDNLTSIYPLTDDDIASTVGQTKNWAATDADGARRFFGQVRELMARAAGGAR